MSPIPVETLELPEPGRALWNTVHQLLRRGFRDRPDRPGVVLTGGTLLAARLHHRASTDIDVKLPQFDTLSTLAPQTDTGRTLDRAIASLGGQRTVTTPSHIAFDFPDGRLDLVPGVLWPYPDPTIAWIDRQQTWIATNTQILSGKLFGRGERAPVRDLVDLAVVGWLDRASAEKAINTLNSSRLLDAADAWHAHADRYRTDAQQHLTDVPDVLAPAIHAPARHAAQTLTDLAWRRIDAEYSREGCRLIGTRFGEDRVLTPVLTTGPSLTLALMAHGIYQEPQRLPETTEPLRHQLEEALRGRHQGRQPIKTVEFDGDAAREKAHDEARTLRRKLDDLASSTAGRPEIGAYPDQFTIEWIPETGAMTILGSYTSADAAITAANRARLVAPEEIPERLIEMSVLQERARALARSRSI